MSGALCAARELKKKALESGQYDKYMAMHGLTEKSRMYYAKRFNAKLSGDSLWAYSHRHEKPIKIT